MKPEQEKDDTSSHILVTSSSLLGLCFIVITSLKALDLGDKTIVDELTGIAIILFMTSSILSFLSLRGRVAKNYRYEIIADYIFLFGMLLIFATAMLLVFSIIR